MCLFSSLGGIFIFRKPIFKKSIFRIFFIIATFFFLVNISLRINTNIFGFNIFNRVLLEDRLEDINSLISRFELWNIASDVGSSSPFFGVGLGNFLEYTPNSFRARQFLTNKYYRKGLPPSYQYPHNILFSTYAESGFFALIVLILMLLYFLKMDISILSRNKQFLGKSLIISFWTLFIFALFNPHGTFKFYVFFWLFRLLIESKWKNYLGRFVLPDKVFSNA